MGKKLFYELILEKLCSSEKHDFYSVFNKAQQLQ